MIWEPNIVDHDPPFWMVRAKRLANLVNPLKAPPWEGCLDCSRQTIKQNIENGFLDERPWDFGDNHMQTSEDLDESYHARRVACLVMEPAYLPIYIDVGIPSMGFQPAYLVQDGNHRLAAALYRKDQWIAVDFSGAQDEFLRLFPNCRAPNALEIELHGHPSVYENTKDDHPSVFQI